MIQTEQLSDVLEPLESVVAKLRAPGYVTRDEIGEMRVALTAALARINAVERIVVGVPPPRLGD